MAVKSGSKKWLLVGLVVAVMVTGFAAVACGGDEATGAEKTVMDMIKAMENKDIDAFVALMDPQGLEQLEAMGMGAEMFTAMMAEEMTYESMKFEGVKLQTELAEDGQTAVVTVIEGKVTTVEGGEETVEDVKDSDEPQVFNLLLRDGKWYLDITGMM
jgi:hypothetical protein